MNRLGDTIDEVVQLLEEMDEESPNFRARDVPDLRPRVRREPPVERNSETRERE